MNKIIAWTIALSGVMSACTTGNKSERSVKYEQYYVEGEQLYLAHCSNCHQKSGLGLGLLYPPLNKSDYMDENLEEVICSIKYGKKGALIVNGKTFNQPMPGVGSLTDLEIAEIATYIYNTWDHERGIVELELVTRVLQKCKRTGTEKIF
jgi:mono/diheme cytochrome c family protein